MVVHADFCPTNQILLPTPLYTQRYPVHVHVVRHWPFTFTTGQALTIDDTHFKRVSSML